jgi:hypothetical protein
MSVHTTTAPLARPMRRRFVMGARGRAIERFLASIRDLWDGSSWEPGRDWLTRVQSPGERQAPR